MMKESFNSWCTPFDRLLGWGFATGNVYELAGESGVGKTQLCLQSMLTVQLPMDIGGLEGSSMYIHTNGNFPVRRLSQMSTYVSNMFGGNERPMDYINVKKVQTVQEIRVSMSHVQMMVENNQGTSMPIRLLIFDSIAALCRGEYGHNANDLGERSNFLRFFGRKVSMLARQYNLVVLLVNEVSDVVPSMGTPNVSFYTSGRRVTPSLGPIWSQYLTTRVFMCIEFDNDGSVKRYATKYNDEENIKEYYKITCDGIS